MRGDTDFRRETWAAALQAGLEVRGYRPTPRDRLAADRAPKDARVAAMDLQTRTRIAEAVVRDRIMEPAAQARVLEAVRERLAAERMRRRAEDLSRATGRDR